MAADAAAAAAAIAAIATVAVACLEPNYLLTITDHPTASTGRTGCTGANNAEKACFWVRAFTD